MQCAYCGKQIESSAPISEDGLYFCNPLHRFSYKESRGINSSSETLKPKDTSISKIVNSPVDDLSEKKDVKNRVGTAIGVLVGLAAGSYLGVAGFVPLILFVIFNLVLKKNITLEPNNKLAIIIQSSHVGWMLIGALILNAWSEMFFDIIVLSIGVLWLFLHFSIIPIILLSIYHIILIYLGAIMLLQTEVGSESFKALIVHIILRLFALFFMSMSYINYRKKTAGQTNASI
ncbi:MAG: hypothetical protein JXA06_09020 [Bacteroidetes bacterium]|nr:hypothetical protein [Bacteroidota bacterium]